MTLLGLCLLTPWNVVLNELDFLDSLYTESRSIAFLIAPVNSYPGIPLLFLLVLYGSKVPLHLRIMGACLLQGAIMVLFPLLSQEGLWVPLSLSFVNGLCTCVLQSSLLGLASLLPERYSQGLMLGQGYAGVVASAAQIIIKAAAGSSSSSSAKKGPALVLFFLAAAIMASGALGYAAMTRTSFVRTTLEQAAAAEAAAVAEASAAGAAGSQEAAAPAAPAAAEESPESQSSSLLPKGSSSGPSVASLLSAVLAVLKKTWRSHLAVHLVFLMTFIVFPALNLSLRYKGSLGASAGFLGSSGWWGVVLLAVFNVCDTVGRALPGYKATIFISESQLLPVVLCRFALIPLFLGCANNWASWMNDIFALCLTAVFAFSNGYLASCECCQWWAAPGAEREGKGRGPSSLPLLSLCAS
jgi:equilibrative nucleoside transporter 1/2/3